MSNEQSGYNDRALTEPSEGALPKPQIEIIVDGNKVFKPGMKTYFVDDYSDGSDGSSATVVGTYCSCDTVLTTRTICTCEHVCTCENVCSCVNHTSCSCVANTSPGTSGGGWVSCGSPCACVPVH